ncbi:ABC transporter permease [Herbinix luporum]|uniref:ABC transporter permease n=1 Tax=Herbinix luporum TaxID=1679721 RepID=UPI00176F8B8C|nr:ABC transporter permease [Herbinix luporum]HHT58070.1 ABC transporter permease [Herbinix luporum]
MISHSIKSIVRTPKKSILFFCLIGFLSIILSIGAGMYMSAHNMLLDADKTFSTVVELSYLGNSDKTQEAFFERMNKDLSDFDFQKLMKDSNVLSVNMEKSAYAYVAENQINQSLSDINNYVIIEVFNIKPYDDTLYQAIVNKVYFGKTMRENTYVILNSLNEYGEAAGYNFVQGHKYLIIGSLADGKNPMPIITPQIPNGLEGFNYVIDLHEKADFYETKEGEELLELAEAFNVVDSSLPVTMVTNLEACEPYFNGDLIISTGRGFLPEEYQEGNNNVILISKTLAEIYELNIGDSLKLNLHYGKKGIGLSDYFKDYSFSYEAAYEVVGIFDNKENNIFKIYMPMADWISQDFHSTTLARYLVKNGTGNIFIEAYKKDLLANMKFTLYDQGYEAALKPIVELKDTSILLLLLGGLSAIIILVLFSYLYVIKQKDTIINMLALGAGKKRTLTYILFGSMLLLMVASTIGAFITSVFIGSLTKIIFDSMTSSYNRDLMYSERALGLRLDFETKIRINYWIPVIIILLILIIGFILINCLTLYVFNGDKFKVNRPKKVSPKKKSIQEIHPSKANKKDILFGRIRPLSLKFALISLVRSAGRSFIVPILAFIMSVFLVFLGYLSNMEKSKKANVYDNIPVNAYMTTFKNETRDLGGLNLQYDIFRLIDPNYSYRMGWGTEVYNELISGGEYSSSKIYEERRKLLDSSEFFKEMYLYNAVHYEYMGISKTKDGREFPELQSYPNIRKHKNAFGFDWFLNIIPKMPKLAYADDIRYTPEFFDNQDCEVEFLSGYDYDSLSLNENIGIIPRNFASENNIDLGDTIRLTAWYIYEEEYALCSVLDLEVIGIYEQTWQSDVIYTPWIMSYDHDYYVDYSYPIDSQAQVETIWIWNEILPRSVRAATFTLKNTKNLAAFREYLDKQGYSEAGQIKNNRRAIVIQDKKLEETIKPFDNHIKLMNILNPIMLILFGVIGFMVSYLLIRHRISELAIMRSMGAKRTYVFLSFFIEQLILFLLGLIPVFIYSLIFPKYFIYYGASVAYFIISYLTGSGLSLIYLGKADLLDILFSKE